MAAMRISDNLGIALASACFLLATGTARTDSTISTTDTERVAYGANTGWINFRWDTGAPGEGATVTGFFLGGFVYGANVGWIDLGDGSPADGIRYGNTDAADFGVNHDGRGNLSGLAYGANVGWINFGTPAPTWDSPPVIDLKTGQFSGYAYGANIGWIDLGENGLVGVVTESIAIGPDTDADGIADAWEYERVIAAGLGTGSPVMDLALLSATGDADLDGAGDVEEFLADSDPFGQGDLLELLSSVRDVGIETVDLTWTSSPRRIYDLYWTLDLVNFTLEEGDILPSPGLSTTHAASSPVAVPRRFWQVRARRPLSP